jgi:hypothetical protein
MIVSELIQALQGMDQSLPVAVPADRDSDFFRPSPPRDYAKARRVRVVSLQPTKGGLGIGPNKSVVVIA